jgi:hypothetical protein
MNPADYFAFFWRRITRPVDRNRTPVELRAVTDEDLWRDITPPPETPLSPILPPFRGDDFSTDFNEEPTREIRRW